MEACRNPDPSSSAPSRHRRCRQGLPLVIALTGFTDAGSAVSGLVDHLRDELNPTPLAVFSNDVLLDYRARRPVISFDQDHLTDYRPPRLELSLAHDAVGQPFLVLAGYEPDFAWDGFAAAVRDFATGLAVSTVTWVHAIPMPVPHTRPIGTTVSGTRKDLTEAHSVGNCAHPGSGDSGSSPRIPPVRRGVRDRGLRAAGAALSRRHQYPAATLAALDSITVATGLVFAGDDLREQNREYLTKCRSRWPRSAVA